MAATIDIYFDFGGSDGTPGTNQDTDALGPPNLKFKEADNATIDALNPIAIPTSGTGYSYWKQIYIRAAVAPDNQIDNVIFYSDGANGFGTGVDLLVGDETPTKNSGSDAGYEVADTTTIMSSAHTGITGTASVFTLTSGASKSVSISEAGNVINAIGETSDYVVLQMSVADTASQGDLTNETLSFAWDES